MDLLLHAWDQPTSHTYAIISGDRDAACIIATLEMRGYNVILLSPAGTHPDLTSQASIQLDWTRSILGVSGQAGVFDNIFEDFRPNIRTTTPLSSQFRRESFSFQQETTAAPIHQSPRGNPIIPSGAKGSPSSLEFSRTLPQGANATKLGSTLANVFTLPVGSVHHYNGTHGSFPTSPSKGKGRLTTPDFKDPETKFEPFNEDHVGEPTRKASVTSASSSLSSDSLAFSLVHKPEQSTAPTSAEEERKLVEEKPSLPVAPLGAVQEKDIKGPSQPADKLFAPAPTANSVPPLPSTKPAGVGIQTTTVTEPKPTPTRASMLSSLLPKAPPAIPATSQPTPRPVVATTIPAAWQPLIIALRNNNGRFPVLKLPEILLKSCPGVYQKAGVGKYTVYIQKAIAAGVVRRVVTSSGSHMIVLTDTYY